MWKGERDATGREKLYGCDVYFKLYSSNLHREYCEEKEDEEQRQREIMRSLKQTSLSDAHRPEGNMREKQENNLKTRLEGSVI